MDDIKRIQCFVCNSQGDFDSNLRSNFSGTVFEYMRCKKCIVGWISNPNMNFEAIYDEEYYKGFGADQDLTYWDEMFPESDDFYVGLRDIEYTGIFDTFVNLSLNKQKSTLMHLDFGGGLGGLSRSLKEMGLKSFLFEEGFAFEVANQLGIQTTDQVEKNFYDFITAIEVLEYLINPQDALKTIARALKPGGILLITTGNLSKHKGPISTWYYARKNPDVHVSFYSPDALSEMLRSEGLSRIQSKLNYKIVYFKILKNVFMLTPLKKHMKLRTIIWKLRFLFIPLVPFADWKFGVSEQSLYQKN
jgi:SAM-dependent methyltransferase